MSKRLVSLQSRQGGFSPFVDVALNGMAAMLVFLAVYVAIVPPRDCPPPPPLHILTDTLPAAVWYNGYQAGLQVSGGTGDYTFDFEPIQDLEAMHIYCNRQTGVISGTPTPLLRENRFQSLSIALRVFVTDQSGQRDSIDLELRITPVALPFDPERDSLAMVSRTRRLPDAWTGQEYEFAPAILGGIEPYEVACDGLPPGLTFTNNRIAGTASQSAVPPHADYRDFTVRLTVSDQQSAYFPPHIHRTPRLVSEYQLRVHRLDAIELHQVLPTARSGQDYFGAIVGHGGRGKLIWRTLDDNLRNLGLSLNPNNGLITGIVTADTEQARPLRVSFRVRVSDQEDVATTVQGEFSIVLVPPMRFVTPNEPSDEETDVK